MCSNGLNCTSPIVTRNWAVIFQEQGQSGKTSSTCWSVVLKTSDWTSRDISDAITCNVIERTYWLILNDVLFRTTVNGARKLIKSRTDTDVITGVMIDEWWLAKYSLGETILILTLWIHIITLIYVPDLCSCCFRSERSIRCNGSETYIVHGKFWVHCCKSIWLVHFQSSLSNALRKSKPENIWTWSFHTFINKQVSKNHFCDHRKVTICLS